MSVVSVGHVRGSVCRSQKMGSDPMELELQKVISHLLWMLGTKLGPLQIQEALLTAELSLQPCLQFSCGAYMFFIHLASLDKYFETSFFFLLPISFPFSYKV